MHVTEDINLQIVLTDYPDNALLENLEYNVGANILESGCGNVLVQGYIWGTPVDRLLEVAPGKYDLIILSDLVFNHSQVDYPRLFQKTLC